MNFKTPRNGDIEFCEYQLITAHERYRCVATLQQHYRTLADTALRELSSENKRSDTQKHRIAMENHRRIYERNRRLEQSISARVRAAADFVRECQRRFEDALLSDTEKPETL